MECGRWLFYGWVCALVAGPAARAGTGALRAIGGRDVLADEVSFVVRIEIVVHRQLADRVRTGYFPVCTGSALEARWTLTARHCVTDDESEGTVARFRQQLLHARDSPDDEVVDEISEHIAVKEVIRYGPPTTDPMKARTSDVLRIFLFPRTRTRALSFDDVALLRTTPVELLEYGRLSALSHVSMFYQEATAMGFGRTNTSSGRLLATLVARKPLQIVRGMFTPCHDTHTAYPLVCLSAPCGRHVSICSGDSGGPVLIRGRIVALNSLAPIVTNCQMKTDRYRRSEFGLVLPLDLYTDWIRRTIESYPNTTDG